MSNHPFRELPSTNPYAPPTVPVDFGSPANPLLFPATALLGLSTLFVLLILASLPGQFVQIRAIDTSTAEGAGELVGSIVSLVVWPLMNVAVALGAVSMLRLKNYSSAYTSAILAIIPVCSPCFVLGIPFGIWALVVLNRPEVKQRFMTK